MVKIRLTRGGTKKSPFYRIIAIDSRRARESRAIDFLGTYHPVSRTSQISLKEEAILEWMNKGAQLSPTVRDLLKTNGVLGKYNAEKEKRRVELRKAKKARAKSGAAPAAAPAESTGSAE